MPQSIPAGGQVDFQVQALIGHDNQISWNVFLHPEFYYYEFAGESSDWSSTQTTTINDITSTATPTTSPSSSPTPTGPISTSQNPTANPTQPDAQTGLLLGLDWQMTALIVMAVAIAALAVAVVVLWRKTAAK